MFANLVPHFDAKRERGSIEPIKCTTALLLPSQADICSSDLCSHARPRDGQLSEQTNLFNYPDCVGARG